MESKKVNVLLVTGFLGSGKTTVMKNLIELAKQTPELNIGVVINEFGKINVDAQTINDKSIEITEINNGSIFCKCLEGTFVDSILALKGHNLDYLFIESSGLSDPSNMQSIMMHVNKFSDNSFYYAGTICVVDAKYFLKLSKSLVTIQRQIASCNLCLVNKIDLAQDSVVESVTKEISVINPFATVHLTTFGNLPAKLFEKLNPDVFSKDMPSLNTAQNRPDVVLLTTAHILPSNFVSDFINAFNSKILRLKGFVRYEDGVYHIEAVGEECLTEKLDLGRTLSELVVIPFPGIAIREEITAYLKGHIDWQCEVI
jgi:G3E family GTPase